MTFTVGLDCEGFIKRGDEYIPACGLIGGDKKNPRLVEKGALQEDNVMFEINIEPATSVKILYDNVRIVISQLEKIIKDQLGDVELVFDSMAKFDKKALNSKKAMEFGCERDYNVYAPGFNRYPNFRKELTRFSGGHIHIGHPRLTHPEIAYRFIKHMDLHLLPHFSLLFKEDYQKSDRNMFYGMPGNFRHKPYGIEYRSLSSHWITSKSCISKIFTAIQNSLIRHQDPDIFLTNLLKTAHRDKNLSDLAAVHSMYLRR